MLKEAFLLYEARRRGRDIELPQPRPFRDYVAWLQSQRREDAQAFWRGYLAGFSSPCSRAAIAESANARAAPRWGASACMPFASPTVRLSNRIATAVQRSQRFITSARKVF